MATVVYSARALAHLERSFLFLAQNDLETALKGAAAIRSGIGALASHPLIGRTRGQDLRELVISFGRTGYVALYRFLLQFDEVRVLAIRHQRELDLSAMSPAIVERARAAPEPCRRIGALAYRGR